MDQFWQNARDRRIALGYSQGEMAKKIGLHQTGYSYFESGKSKRIDSELMKKVAATLGTTVKDLQGANKFRVESFPAEIQSWLETEDCKDYIAEAYARYLNDKETVLR